MIGGKRVKAGLDISEVLLEKDGHISPVPDGIFRWRSQVAKAENLTRGGSRLAPKRATKVAAQCSIIGNVGSRFETGSIPPLLPRPSRGCLLFPCRRSSQSSLIQKVLAAYLEVDVWVILRPSTRHCRCD